MDERFKNWQAPKIAEGRLTEWYWIVQHKKNLKLGKKTDIGAFTAIFAHYGITIEDEVQIGSHCSLYSISTIDDKRGPIVLRKNCRVGAHSVIMPGVTIGENTIVGALSFVNRDLPANEVWAGHPVQFMMTLEEYKKKKRK